MEEMEEMEQHDKEFAFDTAREQAFDDIASTWDEVLGKQDEKKIADLIALLDVVGKTVLDVGAGTGVLIRAGLAAKPVRWISCDLSSQMLRALRLKFTDDPKLAILHADVHRLPLPNHSIDRVICHQSFPHFHAPTIALQELNRVMKPDGRLIINHFAGRHYINQIHRSLEQSILQQDLLEPVDVVKGWLHESGFNVIRMIDEDDQYQIIATKQGG